MLWDTHAPIHGKAICCRIALNLSRDENISVAEVGTRGCPSLWFNGAPLIPPHFKNRGTLVVDTLIDIVGQNWFGIARLGTPLQQTAVQRGPLLRWPQLSRLAWARENVSVFQVINRRCPATLCKPSEHPPSGEKMSEGLGGNIGCRDKTSSWYQSGSPM